MLLLDILVKEKDSGVLYAWGIYTIHIKRVVNSPIIKKKNDGIKTRYIESYIFV